MTNVSRNFAWTEIDCIIMNRSSTYLCQHQNVLMRLMIVVMNYLDNSPP